MTLKRLFIDNNIILDLLAKRKPYYDAASVLFSLGDKGKVKLSVSSLTFINTHYVLAKLKSKEKSREILRKFKMLVKVSSCNEKIIDLALNDRDFPDFEDSIQYLSATENRQDAIITRNIRDFKYSKIPVMTAEDFLKLND
jgi:predicted nucleic acid-binding protein